MNLDLILMRLAESVKELDLDIRAMSPKCPACGLPTGGVMMAGESRADAGICGCDQKPKEGTT